MIIEAARAAISQLFTPPFRGAFFKSLGLTLLVLAGLWLALSEVFEAYAMPWLDLLVPDLPSWAGWLSVIAAIVAGIGLALALALLIAPVTALIAGFFLDDVAEAVETVSYPQDPPGKAVPLVPGIVLALKFFGVVILANLVALLLLLVPGVNLIIFFIVNGYLLGREFFEFAAMRFRSEAEAKALRRRHAGTIFVAGLVVAGFLAVPFLNLLTPLLPVAARQGACRSHAGSGVAAHAWAHVSSTETKAVEAAAILAAHVHIPMEVEEKMGENDRSSTGFLEPQAFEAAADCLFAEPEKSWRGWERAVDAADRIESAAMRVLKGSVKPVLMIGHGGVGTLLKCRIAGQPISRDRDQPSGGGSLFAFDIAVPALLCDWTPMESFRGVDYAG